MEQRSGRPSAAVGQVEQPSVPISDRSERAEGNQPLAVLADRFGNLASVDPFGQRCRCDAKKGRCFSEF
jgi:hypothetical protein